MSDEKKTEEKKEEKAKEEISKIAEKLGKELTFGSSLGRYWFVYLLGTIGGAGLGALLGWSTGRLLELADWLGVSIGAGAGALVGFGASAGVTRQLDKNTIRSINAFALEAEKAMKAQESGLKSEIDTLRSNLKASLEKELGGKIDAVQKDVDAIGTQIDAVPTPKRKPAAKKPAAKNTKKGRKKAA